MANSNLLAPIFRGATGGLSDDIFSGIQDSFFYSRNVDTRNLVQGIILSKKLKSVSGNLGYKINVIIKIKENDYFAFGAKGKIFRFISNNWVPVSTNTHQEDIISANVFNGYMYWATKTRLARIKLEDIGAGSTSLTSNEVLNFKLLEDAPYHPLMVSMGSMFVGNYDKLDEVDVENTYEELTTIEKGSIITHFGDLGGMIRAITLSPLGYNNVYLIGKGDKLPEQNIPLYGAGIKHSILFNGYNYLTTGAGLNILDGYKIYPIKEIKDITSNIGAVGVYQNTLLFGGKGGIYSWGRKNKNYSESLSLEYVTSNKSIDDEITAIFSDGINLFVARKNGTNFGIDLLDETLFGEKGELITRGYFATNLHSIKEAISTSYGFEELKEGEKITLYYSINGGDFVKIIEIEDNERITSFTDDSFCRGEFQYVQFKIELEGTGTTSPTFYSADLLFNDNLKR